MAGIAKKSSNICEVCQQPFHKISLAKHMLKHSQEKQFKCQVCGKAFFLVYYLNSHMIKHVESELFKCDICEKSFILKKQLNAHKKIHSKRKSYTCKLCPKTSNFPIHKNHVLQHTSEIYIECSVCVKKFKNSNQLRTHMKNIHEKTETSFSCTECPKHFKYQKSVPLHH